MISPVLIVVVVGVAVGLLLGRRSVWLGMVVLTAGAGQFGALYVYEVFIHAGGDNSGLGMLSTICLILTVPLGLLLIIVGLVRVD